MLGLSQFLRRIAADVGFPVGGRQGINQFVMQIHYKNPIPGE